MTQSSSRKPAILVVDDDATLNQLMSSHLRRAGYEVENASRWSEAQSLLGRLEPDLVLLDAKLPDADGLAMLPSLVETCPVIMLTAFGSIDLAVQAIKRGAVDFLAKPVNPDVLDLAVKRAISASSMRRRYDYYRRQATSALDKTLVGLSPAMARLRKMIGIVGPSDTTVLILGESGVGKELVAAAVHQASARADQNYVAIDCATLQQNLFESELFGHERGAFTGADRRKEGLIEVGEGGTAFLDEIGEMSGSLQAKLLRVLETGHYRRLGGTKDLVSNVRFVAATNRDLRAMCGKGEFREDLYYRLSAFVLHVPPLRERLEDIPLLAEHFLAARDFARHARKRWSPAALEALMDYAWPGNVRELRNIVERAALVSGESDEIRVAHLGDFQRRPPPGRQYAFSFDHPPTLDEITETYLARLLAERSRSRAEIAQTLGISERNLYRLINARRRDG
ncbi:sigma-54 dependent transcriptional regulator [Alsobacter sp. SYSU M60028]|uniref:Sigma-54 dependent transcriptional regulator n=1 Tax=Alsobacter ponti TaxID=2962936 RepID=A0ABT1LDI2_9HYPH|nr:sigma-54 dependent transcriptional regulator [Alsobacter ponti]MCP8939571.1 sigma-54 dependent transcriptional regulator [Alsobacter ponti]